MTSTLISLSSCVCIPIGFSSDISTNKVYYFYGFPMCFPAHIYTIFCKLPLWPFQRRIYRHTVFLRIFNVVFKKKG